MAKIYIYTTDENQININLEKDEVKMLLEFVKDFCCEETKTPYTKECKDEKDEAIQKLKDLGCSVKKVEEDVDVYECKTSATWENKFALVKAWLIDHGVEFEEKLNCVGRKEIYYDLDMMQLAEMIDWLDDHSDEKFDTVIQI